MKESNLSNSHTDWGSAPEIGPSDYPELFDRVTGEGPFICTGVGPDNYGRWYYYTGKPDREHPTYQGFCAKWPQTLTPQRLEPVVLLSELNAEYSQNTDLQYENSTLRCETQRLRALWKWTVGFGMIFAAVAGIALAV